jgi:hypothetical protein
MVDKKQIAIVGGIHDIATGLVTFFEQPKFNLDGAAN